MERIDCWPDGPTMQVVCPWCAESASVDVSGCKEMGAGCRPVDCDSCGRSYELQHYGATLKLVTRRTAHGFLQEVYVP